MGTTLRRRLAVVLVALLAGVSLARLRGHSGAAPPAAGAPAGGAAAAASLHRGGLSFSRCSIGARAADALPTLAAWCTRVRVPENWSDPHGRHIGLRVALVTAEAARPEPDLVVFLDGGPGGAATADFPAVAAAFEPLRERHDILLIDQRGTGGSHPLDCPQLQAPSGEAGRPLEPPPPAAALEQRLRACLAALQGRADPQYYTTTAAVRDLEAVREALGAPPLDLVGISYGTRLAQQYAGRYPQAVRSIVLDSPVPNRLVLLSAQAVNLERALRADFALCTGTPACAARFGDPYATLYRVRARLLAHPVSLELNDPVSFAPLHLTLTPQSFATIVRFYAYDSHTAALLPLMLQQADRGNYAPLLGQQKFLADDLGSQLDSALQLSVICAEDVDLLEPQPRAADTLLGNGAIERARAACRVWPKGSRPADFHTPLVTSLPVLVLSGELDPVTPPAYGRQILEHLSDARQLIAPGQGHAVLGAGCMPRLVQRFVATLDPRGLDAHCLLRLGPTPAFLDYNGAGP